jgi:hypothetical protein
MSRVGDAAIPVYLPSAASPDVRRPAAAESILARRSKNLPDELLITG